MNRLVLACVALSGIGLVALAKDASADEKGSFTLPVTTIYGRPPRPSAAVEIARARMTLPPKPLDGPSAAAVSAAAKKAPF